LKEGTTIRKFRIVQKWQAKRIKATCSIPEQVERLNKETGEKKINDNALTALSLLIAVSDPKEKDKLVKIVTNLLTG
jgi:hypothetical protein